MVNSLLALVRIDIYMFYGGCGPEKQINEASFIILLHRRAQLLGFRFEVLDDQKIFISCLYQDYMDSTLL